MDPFVFHQCELPSDVDAVASIRLDPLLAAICTLG